MKKCILVASVLYSTLAWGGNLTGTVKTDTQVPVANVVVSDGYSVVQTDANGEYTMPYNASAAFVFVSLPSGYDMANANGLPQIWQTINKSQITHTHHFTLHQQEDGGKADSAHVLIAMADPQVFTDYDRWRFQHETIEDIDQLIASYPAGTKFVGLTLGDVVWDKYKFFPNQKETYQKMPFRNFLAIGNHDHNRGAEAQATILKQDSVASLLYESYFGPTYYSFNIGAIHYIVLDNILYKGNAEGDKSYTTQLTDKQKNWIVKDIAQLQQGTQIVFAMHSMATGNTTDYNYLRDQLVKMNPNGYVLTGHSHTNSMTYNTYGGITLMEHNIAAVGGSFWSSDWCGDGSPNGYKVFETSPTGITNWYYKGTGLDSKVRLSAFPTNSIETGKKQTDVIIVNAWEWEKKCTVQVAENGVLEKMNQAKASFDPDVYDIMLSDGDTRPNYPGSEGGTDAGKNPGVKETNHIFTYYPTSQDSKIEIVFTDHFGHKTIMPVLRHQMVAAFTLDTTTQQWSYQQDFNRLPAYPNYCTGDDQRGTWIAGHTPQGWYGATSGKVMPGEGTVTWTGFNHLQINGGPVKPWLWSCGTPGATLAENSRERALGSLNSSNHKRICYGVIMENNTGSTITALDVSYAGEVWHIGTGNTAKESLKVSYAILTDAEARQIRDRKAWIGQIATTAASQLTFTTPDNLTTAEPTQIHGQISLSLAPHQVVLLRWDDDLATSGDNDHALAIDDVKIIPTLATDLSETTSATGQHTQGGRTVLIDGQVLIQTDHDLYTLTGLKK